MIAAFISAQKLLNQSRHLDFIGLLALRLYLAPIFISAGLHKALAFENTAEWFGDSDWGLGLPFPVLLTSLAIFTELVGGVALLLGFATRWFSAAISVTMLVAIFSVHLPNGWFAIAPSNPSTSTAAVLAKVGIPGAESSLTNSQEVGERLTKARSILRENGNYAWLTEKGQFVVLNNGIEFAATYLLMLALLLFYGAGRLLSIDYWLARRFL